jgi:hypothetical protein
MVDNGRQIAAALRHLDSYGAEQASAPLAEAMGRFLVERAEARHAGWRTLRQVVIDASITVPWERCARRAVPLVADDLIQLSIEAGRTPLHRGQHVAGQRRAETIAPFVPPRALLRSLDLPPQQVDDATWAETLRAAATARSREGVARQISASLGLSGEDEPESEAGEDER